MHPHPQASLGTQHRWEILLDDLPIEIPQERRSLAGIRCYLETLAFQRQRLLSSFEVVEQPAASGASALGEPCTRVQARTVTLEEFPLELLQTAREQTVQARTGVESALLLVTINAGAQARELWWEVAPKLKDPIVTLSLLAEGSLGLSTKGVSLLQLRKWQLEQLAAILQDVDQAAFSEDPIALSEALEHRVLPWLSSLADSLELLHETLLSAHALAAA